jgi:hypothetical protein
MSLVTYSKSETVIDCPICEIPIKPGDDILWWPPRRSWEHVTCPWRKDDGYRPDMVIIDVDDEYFAVKEHIKNQEKDEENQSGTIELGSWSDRLWKRIQYLFGY